MKKNELNVLIVEDDKSLSSALSEAVKRQGYKPIAVMKPDEAESVVKIKPIHALIVDCMLPGKNGVDLVVKLKENLVDNAAIVLTSGIYRDKTYSQEAIRKTEALEFFPKPFELDQVMQVIGKALSVYVETPKVDLHALLATPYAGQRERRKALDYVEELCGFDLPFVFCILMDSESSGHLNIVDKDQNIYGATFAKGILIRIDSEDTQQLTKKALLKHGFITELELSEVKSKSGDIVKALVSEGLMSPHAENIIRMETLVREINKLIGDGKIKANFVPDRKVKPDDNGIGMQAFLPQLHDIIENMIPVTWLKNFYSVWSGHPIRLSPQWSDVNETASTDLVQKAKAMIQLLKKEATIEDIIAQSGLQEETIYKALHLLSLRRMVVFEEVKRVRNLDEHVSRLKSMHAAIVGKTPEEIFEYFGLGSNPKTADITKVFKEFAKSNHPDTLPQSVSEEVKKLNTELFAAVTAAHDTLTDEEKRAEYLNAKRSAEAEVQLKSDELVTAGAQLLTRGKYADALPILKKANEVYASERAILHLLWARFKVDGEIKESEYKEIEAKLDKMSRGSQKNPIYFFVMGLLEKKLKNMNNAAEYFNRAIKLDERFMDARRELAATKTGDGSKKNDLLNGDISVVMKNFFKKRGA